MSYQQSDSDGWYSYPMPTNAQNTQPSNYDANIPPQNTSYYQLNNSNNNNNNLSPNVNTFHKPQLPFTPSHGSSPYSHPVNSGSATSFIYHSQNQNSNEINTKFSIWDIIGVGNLDGTEPPLLEGRLSLIKLISFYFRIRY